MAAWRTIGSSNVAMSPSVDSRSGETPWRERCFASRAGVAYKGKQIVSNQKMRSVEFLPMGRFRIIVSHRLKRETQSCSDLWRRNFRFSGRSLGAAQFDLSESLHRSPADRDWSPVQNEDSCPPAG